MRIYQYESYESYNIYYIIHYTLYIIYRRRREHPEGRKDIRRILRRWARKSRSQRAAKNVAAACFVEGIRRTTNRSGGRHRASLLFRRASWFCGEKRQSDDEFTPHCLRWSLLVVVAALLACSHQRVDEHNETKLELNHHDISLYSTKLN